MKSTKSIYLDYAATTPIDPLVKKAMEPFLAEKFGNPSALYKQGREAKAAVDTARKSIAEIIKARPEEIIFTAGGTEADNLAIFGAARGALPGKKAKPHIITTAIEHHAVLNCVQALETQGYKASYIGVNGEGFINVKDVQRAILPETILVSVILANNEIGSIQPVSEIGSMLNNENRDREKKGLPRILFHTDACQASGVMELNIQKLGVDLMSVNASKIYGPKQGGFLFVRSGVNLKPLIYGGGQERNLRSGTENVAAIVGLAKAFKLAQKNFESENKRLIKLRNYFTEQIFKILPKAILNGPEVLKKQYQHKLNRLPNNINFTFPGVEGEALLIYLDAYGISVGTGSACDNNSADPSHVLMAIGRSASQAKESIRFSLGKFTTKKDLDYVLKVLPGLVKSLGKVNKL